MVTASGEKRWVQTDKVPYRETRERCGVLLFCVDITERKRAEEALREGQRQNEFLASIIEPRFAALRRRLPDGVWAGERGVRAV